MATNTVSLFLHPFRLPVTRRFHLSSLIQPLQIALKLVRQGVSNEPPRDITIVEADKKSVNFDVATKVEDKNSKNSIAEDASVDVGPIDSSLDNINVVPLTTESEVGHNEHSNEAPTKTFAEETAKLSNTSKIPEVI
jgi:Lon-like ATP-dependent protease